MSVCVCKNFKLEKSYIYGQHHHCPQWNWIDKQWPLYKSTIEFNSIQFNSLAHHHAFELFSISDCLSIRFIQSQSFYIFLFLFSSFPIVIAAGVTTLFLCYNIRLIKIYNLENKDNSGFISNNDNNNNNNNINSDGNLLHKYTAKEKSLSISIRFDNNNYRENRTQIIDR